VRAFARIDVALERAGVFGVLLPKPLPEAVVSPRTGAMSSGCKDVSFVVFCLSYYLRLSLAHLPLNPNQNTHKQNKHPATQKKTKT
jgi:hypothetical protein